MEAEREGVCLHLAEQEERTTDMVPAEGVVLVVLALALLREGHRPGRDYGSAGCQQKKNSIRAISDGYHIGDRDDGHDDDDGSSRTWPSRTRWGSAYSLSEKFPWLLERKFGIAAFDYWWGYTAAEIDLMVIDQPVISYKTEKKKSMMASRKEAAELDALTEAWENKRKGKSLAGKELSLSEFMKQKV